MIIQHNQDYRLHQLHKDEQDFESQEIELQDLGSQCKPVEPKQKGEALEQHAQNKAQRKQFLESHTETDKIRSTPLSGFFLQTSRMEAAILIQIFLSDMNSLNPFGSNTPWKQK